jgi:hypothetical protein
LFEAPGQKTGGREKKKWVKEAFEGNAQLQAGAGNEIGPAREFQKVTRIDVTEPLFRLQILGEVTAQAIRQRPDAHPYWSEVRLRCC